MSTGRGVRPTTIAAACLASAILALLCNHWARLTIAAVDAGTILSRAGVNAAAGAIVDLVCNPLSFETGQLGLSSSLFGAGLPWLGLCWSMRSAGTYRPGEEHGSSRWLSPGEARRFADRKDQDNNVILSRCGRMVLDPGSFDLERDRNKNVLIIGGPGSGKTRTFIKPNLMQLNSSVWVTDPKGTLPPEVGEMFVDAGYDLRVFNTIDFSRSMHFNPFAYIRRAADIPPLVECIVSNVKPKDSGRSGDPFWEQTEKQLIVALVAYMFEALPPERRTFVTLNKLLSMIEIVEGDASHKSPLDILFASWKTGEMPGVERGVALTDDQATLVRQGRAHPDSYAVVEYEKFRVGAGKTLKSVLMSVNSDLWQFDLPEVLELTSYDEMDLGSIGGLCDDDLDARAADDPSVLEPGKGVPRGATRRHPGGQRKTALFVVMDDQDPTYRFLVAVLTYLGISCLKTYADTRCGGRLPIPVQLYLDEFANIGKISNFEQVITTIRSRRMAAFVAIQSLGQLDSNYGETEATIIKDACDTWVYLGGCGPDTCKVISDKIGNQTVGNRNTSRTYAERRSGSVSEQVLQRPLIDPAEVGRIERRRCLVMISGAHPLLDDKYRLEEHTRYQLVDPGHAAGRAHGRRWPRARFDKPFDEVAWRRAASARRLWRESGSGSVRPAQAEAREAFVDSLAERLLEPRDQRDLDAYLASIGADA